MKTYMAGQRAKWPADVWVEWHRLMASTNLSGAIVLEANWHERGHFTYKVQGVDVWTITVVSRLA